MITASASQRVREFSKAALADLDEMRLPELSSLLNKKFASASNEQHICPVCKMAFGSKRSLASHLKKHKAGGELEVCVSVGAEGGDSP